MQRQVEGRGWEQGRAGLAGRGRRRGGLIQSRRLPECPRREGPCPRSLMKGGAGVRHQGRAHREGSWAGARQRQQGRAVA